MPRPKLSDEERAKRKAERNKAYYAEKVIKGKDGEEKKYSDYLSKIERKQLKLTLTDEEYDAIKNFCDANKLKPQDYIRQLIREDLGL